GQGRRHRPGQGRPLGAAERRVDCLAPADDRGDDCRNSRGEEGRSCRASGNGRNVLTLRVRSTKVEVRSTRKYEEVRRRTNNGPAGAIQPARSFFDVSALPSAVRTRAAA